MDIQKVEFFLPSNDQKHKLHCILWKPADDREVKHILQISHGMQEYLDRYDDFARFMVQHGYAVVGNDHLGHGGTVNAPDELGFFVSKDASRIVVADVYTVTKYIRKQYPNASFYLLGHSMGSFIARRYLMEYGNEVDRAIIMGTGSQPKFVLMFGTPFVHLMQCLYGEKHRSKLLAAMMMGNYNKKFSKDRFGRDWITSDPEMMKKILRDDKCKFLFTVNGILFLLNTVSFIQNKKNIKKIPLDLPILFISGMDDPVGNFGCGVRKAMKMINKCGIKKTTLHMIKGDRHEVLNEQDRSENYQYILHWLSKQ